MAVVHAAWHSCGSYQVNVSQIAAYQALGARVVSVAMMDALGPAAPNGARWTEYLEASRDVGADARYFSGAPYASLASPRFLAEGYWRLIHGDQASWLIELAKYAPTPKGFENGTIDLVHANHYFTLPFVETLLRGRRAPVIVETQDIQARQYVLRNKGGFFIPPYASYDDMLKVELDWMRRADLNAHLNEEEHRDFQALLPEARHALIYPAVTEVPCAKGRDIIIVASDNYANYMSLRWLLQEVAPRAGDARVSIYGNIDGGVRRRDPALYEAHREVFKGRVDDIGAVYAAAGCVLLPTAEGHGLSIKAVEALSCGAPLVATSLAFRGMGVDPRALANVAIADDAESFAAAWREAQRRCDASDAVGAETSDTRRLYEATFSREAYVRALASHILPLLSSRGSGADA